MKRVNASRGVYRAEPLPLWNIENYSSQGVNTPSPPEVKKKLRPPPEQNPGYAIEFRKFKVDIKLKELSFCHKL